ncbi:metal ABC transporter solute-binding protein, Zn/Mn family [Arthrobacter sp.]|uniref:metal ABC transporter solute-binding protein, Zn/Mn family n=1 Tax=Arthrobacter sp. TaxID=1667 RepID=UPI002811DBD6|nr:zinc ABC transporter substrate-binding protein [Arthrobacter sp.]
MRHFVLRPSLAAVAGLGLLLTGCAGAPSSAPSQSADGTIEVVASTNVYGDIVSDIGGDKVHVTSIITRTSQDPHSYEATTQDKLVISKAQVVVQNGGGYDDFIHKLADDSKIAEDNIITAVDVSGLAPEEEEAHASESPTGTATESAHEHEHEHGEFNEHVWYSFDAMSKLADAVAAKLSTIDSASASTFQANAESFKKELSGLQDKLAAVKASADGEPVAITEPVPGYLLESAGLVNKTPEEYSAAIEEGTDVPASVLQEATALVSSGDVKLLAYNLQTEGPQTEVLKKAAEGAGVPVVDFSETLPDGKSYLQWMSDNVDNVTKAVNK